MRKVTFILALGAVSASILSGCKSKSKYKTPTNPYDKVSVALKGVEKSFANYKIDERTNASSKTTRSGKRVAQSDSTGALNEIAALYQSYDSQGDKIDELDFSKPPMTQFNSIKRFYESLGQSFSFGTKYTDTVTGVVYFDPTTGDKKEELPAYKYDYNFTISLALSINDQDVITGDVVYKIDLSQGDVSLHTNWYFGMTLDYEMSKESPTYTLSMFTEILESDLSYLDYGNTYEYDFVDMKDNRVNEWRKFCYEVNKRMVKDQNHQTFADYLAEPDFKGQIGSSKWYKNANLRKISHPNSSRTRKFISALFDKFGLNATDINSEAFISRSATQNTTIGQLYKEFSAAFKQDAIYSAITGNEGHKQQKVRRSMKVMDENFEEFTGYLTISSDTTFRELFGGEDKNLSIWYFDENDDALDQAENLNALQFLFTIRYGNGEFVTYGNESLDTNISSLYEALGAKKYDDRLTYALLEINDNLEGFNVIFSVTIDSELKEQIDLYFKAIFPYAITELGFPTYSGENCLFDYKNEMQTFVDISRTNQTELTAFENGLVANGWVKEEGSSSTHFRKFVDPTQYDMEVISNGIANGNVRIVYNKIDWPRAAIKSASNGIFDFPFPTTENGYFEIDSNRPGTIILKNFSEYESLLVRNMFLSLHDGGAVRNNSIFVKKDNVIYQFNCNVSEGDIILDYTYREELSYDVYEIIIEKDGVEAETIQLDSDLKGYFLKKLFAVGTYKVKAHNLHTSEEAYIPVSGADLDSYKDNVSFNATTNELEVTTQTELDLRMNFNETSQIVLFELEA